YLDGADGATPGFERPPVADVEHDPLDVPRILAQDVWLVEQHVRLEVGLVGLDRGVAADAFVGHDPNDGVVADQGALEISDAHQSPVAYGEGARAIPSSSGQSASGIGSAASRSVCSRCSG